jgi:hypothetical protein
MKRMITVLCMLCAVYAAAQNKYVPAIKQGTKLNYAIYFNGQTFSGIFSLDSVSADYVKVGWNIDQLGMGSWIMKSKSINNGVRGYWGQPSPGINEELPEDVTVLLFSKAQWASLQKDKKLTFDQQTFTLKEPSEKQLLNLSGQTVDALMLESQNSSTRIWILNSASYLVLLKIEGNTLGADLTISSVQ